MTTTGTVLPTSQEIVSNSNAITKIEEKTATKGLADNFDAFLQLFLTQLKHQDPTSPLDTNEMGAQLAQFAGVEQAIKVNTNLNKLIAQNQASELASVLSYNGSIVKVENNAFELTKIEGEGEAADSYKGYYSYEIEGEAESASIAIKNEDGTTVFAGPVDYKSGKHDFTWDGKDNSGNQLEEGIYTVEVKAKIKDGGFVNVKTIVESVVQAVSVEDGVVNLHLTSGETVGTDKILYVGPKVL